MLHHIKPAAKYSKSKDGTLTTIEKSLVKGLIKAGYRTQDIVHIVNQGRISTTNSGRVTEVSNNSSIVAATNKKVEEYLKIQSAYDPQTLLNPYKNERLIRSREAMITAVQIFNSPTITFKTEVFCVMANIAWTYLLHEKVEQIKTGSSVLGNGKSISVNEVLKRDFCPIKDVAAKENLKKVIEIRDAVEHTVFLGGDECFGALFQTCVLNFEKHLTAWFGNILSLSKELSLALQFVRLNKAQITAVESAYLPAKIQAIHTAIQESPYADNPAFQLKVYYTTEATSKTAGDLHKLIIHDADTPANVVEVIKKVAHKKITELDILKRVRAAGYKDFTSEDHRKFWRQKWGNAQQRNKNPEAAKYGEVIMRNIWIWHEETWLPAVLAHCKEKYT